MRNEKMNKDTLVDEIVEQLGISSELSFTVEQAVYLATVYGSARLVASFVEDQKTLRISLAEGIAQIVNDVEGEVDAEFDIDVDAFNDYVKEVQKLAVHAETHEKLVGLSVNELVGHILAKIGDYQEEDVLRYVTAATLNPGYSVFNDLFNVTIDDSQTEAVVVFQSVPGEDEEDGDNDTLVVRLNADDFAALQGVRPVDAAAVEEDVEEDH